MPNRRARLLFAAWIAAGALALAGCDSVHTRIFAGSTITPTDFFVGTRVMPLPLPLGSVVGFGCPFIQPFSTQFDFIVDGTSRDLFLNQVSFTFVDGSGFSGTPLLISTADLNARFGHTRIAPGMSRAFRFQPQFGCGLARPQLLLLGAILFDGTGQQMISLRLPLG